MSQPFRSPSRRRFLRSSAAAVAGGAFLPSAVFGQRTGEAMPSPTHESCFGLLEQGKRIPVIFDTDIGDDIDDTWALLYLLKCPELDVRLIVCEDGHSRYRAQIVAKLLEAVGRTDIPVALGKRPEGSGRQRDWVEGYDLDAYSGELLEDAAQAIVETTKASELPMTVLGIGPVPAIADALRLDPWIAQKARFVGMHGSIFVGYDGSGTPVNEYNVKQDPAALRTVLEADWEPSLTPLDTCGALRLAGEKYAKVRSSASPGVRELMDNYDAWLPNAKWVEGTDAKTESTTLFDIVAVTMAFTERWLQMETLPIVVDDEGYTKVNREDGRPTRLALQWRDLEGYEDHVVERLTGDIVSAA